MTKKVVEMVGLIKNPLTGKSLVEEGRLIECLEKDGGLAIIYSREGIDPATKRRIEDAIVFSFKNQYPEDKIWVKTISKDSSDVHKAASASLAAPVSPPPSGASPASLKVGHGTVGNKRRVSNVKRVVCVSSCKGGVGKSTVAINLALALVRQGKKVGILDADIYGPSVPTLLNQASAQPKSTKDKKIQPIQAYGLEFISLDCLYQSLIPSFGVGPCSVEYLTNFIRC